MSVSTFLNSYKHKTCSYERTITINPNSFSLVSSHKTNQRNVADLLTPRKEKKTFYWSIDENQKSIKCFNPFISQLSRRKLRGMKDLEISLIAFVEKPMLVNRCPQFSVLSSLLGRGTSKMAAGGNGMKGKICKCSRETCVENLMATETEVKQKKKKHEN